MANPNWKPGVSGNPNGRPRIVGEIRALARQHTQSALEALVQIVGDKKAPAAARVAAASHILDRGYGRPESKLDATIETANPGGPRLDPDKLTQEDWAALEALRPMLERARIRTETEH